MGYKSVFKCIKLLDSVFSKADINSPKLSAELITCFVLNINRSGLYLERNLCVSKKDFKKIISLARRRLAHEPVQYIIGQTNFYGLDFYVDSNVLIPRPETELLVEAVIDAISQINKPLNVLDIGTGSGIIPVTLAKNLKNIFLTAVDISDKALLVAQDNANIHNVSECIKFLKSDIYSAFNGENENTENNIKFDIIISNPPYIDKTDMEKLDEEVKKYEPSNALFGGDDGLIFYRRILEGSISFLNKEGMIFLEIGYNQAKDLQEIGEKAGLKFVRLIKDYNDFDRVLVFKKH